MNQRFTLHWKQVLMFLMVVSAPVNNAHWESTAYAHMQSTSAALPIYTPRTVYDCNTNYLQYPATNIIFLQLWWYRVHSSMQFTVQTISSLTNLDHNPLYVHSMYIIPQNHNPDNNVLMANILCSSLFYHSTGILTTTILFLSVEWSTHKYICVLIVTTLKMVTRLAKTCRWSLYNKITFKNPNAFVGPFKFYASN